MKSREEIVEALLQELQREANAKIPEPPSPFVVEVCNHLMRPLAQDIAASGVRYLIVDKGTAIMCFQCGAVSHKPTDVEQRYCGSCHAFLGEARRG
jgi:hypothetical protein